MMLPDIFAWLTADAGVTAKFGTKLWPWGESPDEPPAGRYCVWQQLTGVPENYLDTPVQIDSARIQFDIYEPATSDSAECEDAAQAIRDCLEQHGYMIDFGTTERDPSTRAYRYRLDFDFLTPRG